MDRSFAGINANKEKVNLIMTTQIEYNLSFTISYLLLQICILSI